MAVKEWFRELQPVQLYIVLFFTAAYFAVEIITSYVTHSLTLLMNAYHMLCNIVALVGCIASIKYENENNRSNSNSSSMCSLKNSSNSLNEKVSSQPAPAVSTAATTTTAVTAVGKDKSKQLQSRREKRMKNTFGWARIDVVTMLICCVLLASFCFSMIVESAQTLIHIGHRDAMHHPLPVMCIGACGILLNAFCYFLIGGYTFNQGVFLHFTQEGNVILKRSTSSQSTDQGSLEPTRRSPIRLPQSQGVREMCRDVLGCVLVMITSSLVYFYEHDIGKYVDPIIAIVSAILLFILSYPYMKESSMILLQTIPNHINIESLQKDLLSAFPDIVNVHDLHVWQLNGEKVVSTVHIIYSDPTVCARITDQITNFFIEMGITHVTIQPEFCKMIPHTGPHVNCLIRCQSKICSSSTCCSRGDVLEEAHYNQNRHIINRKFGSKEILPLPPGVVFNVTVDEISEVKASAVCDIKKARPPTSPAASSPKTTDSEPDLTNEGHSHTINVEVVKSASSLASTETEPDNDTKTKIEIETEDVGTETQPQDS